MNQKLLNESDVAEFFVKKFGKNIAETSFLNSSYVDRFDVNIVIYFIRDGLGDVFGAIEAISKSNLQSSNESSYRYLRGISFFKAALYQQAFDEFSALESTESRIKSMYFIDEARALAAISAKKIGKMGDYERLRKLVPIGHMVYVGSGIPMRFHEFN